MKNKPVKDKKLTVKKSMKKHLVNSSKKDFTFTKVGTECPVCFISYFPHIHKKGALPKDFERIENTCTNCGQEIGKIGVLSPTTDPKKRNQCLNCAEKDIEPETLKKVLNSTT